MQGHGAGQDSPSGFQLSLPHNNPNFTQMYPDSRLCPKSPQETEGGTIHTNGNAHPSHKHRCRHTLARDSVPWTQPPLRCSSFCSLPRAV
jgi:hypothetical protein